MGISGLLQLLQPLSTPRHISHYANTTVGVDASCWLHRASYSCAMELCRGIPTLKYLSWMVTPYIVFDGAELPLKRQTNAARQASRQHNKQQGDRCWNAGQQEEAGMWYQRAIHVTNQMCHHFMCLLDKMGVKYIVAPYEADAQLAYLMRQKLISCVITEDSDLLVFGCSRVLLKLDDTGNGIEMDWENGTIPSEKGDPKKASAVAALRTLKGFQNPTALVDVCILAGCDYLESLHGMGLRTAIKRYEQGQERMPDVWDIIKHSTRNKKAKKQEKSSINRDYHRAFTRAKHTFLYQTVCDPQTNTLTTLTPLSDEIRDTWIRWKSCVENGITSKSPSPSINEQSSPATSPSSSSFAPSSSSSSSSSSSLAPSSSPSPILLSSHTSSEPDYIPSSLPSPSPSPPPSRKRKSASPATDVVDDDKENHGITSTTTSSTSTSVPIPSPSIEPSLDPDAITIDDDIIEINDDDNNDDVLIRQTSTTSTLDDEMDGDEIVEDVDQEEEQQEEKEEVNDNKDDDDLSYLGPLVPPALVEAVCTGRVSPQSHTPYTHITPDIHRQLDDMVAGRKLNSNAVKSYSAAGNTPMIQTWASKPPPEFTRSTSVPAPPTPFTQTPMKPSKSTTPTTTPRIAAIPAYAPVSAPDHRRKKLKAGASRPSSFVSRPANSPITRAFLVSAERATPQSLSALFNPDEDECPPTQIEETTSTTIINELAASPNARAASHSFYSIRTSSTTSIPSISSTSTVASTSTSISIPSTSSSSTVTSTSTSTSTTITTFATTLSEDEKSIDSTRGSELLHALSASQSSSRTSEDDDDDDIVIMSQNSSSASHSFYSIRTTPSTSIPSTSTSKPTTPTPKPTSAPSTAPRPIRRPANSRSAVAAKRDKTAKKETGGGLHRFFTPKK